MDELTDAMGDLPERAVPKAASEEIALACPLALRFHDDMAGSQSSVTWHSDELAERLRVMNWKALPDRAKCGGRRDLTLRPKGFGDFVTEIARSDDGRFVGMRGGWQAAPLMGGGADCLYEQRSEGYALVGCVRTWVS